MNRILCAVHTHLLLCTERGLCLKAASVDEEHRRLKSISTSFFLLCLRISISISEFFLGIFSVDYNEPAPFPYQRNKPQLKEIGTSPCPSPNFPEFHWAHRLFPYGHTGSTVAPPGFRGGMARYFQEAKQHQGFKPQTAVSEIPMLIHLSSSHCTELSFPVSMHSSCLHCNNGAGDSGDYIFWIPTPLNDGGRSQKQFWLLWHVKQQNILPCSFLSPSVKRSLQDRTDIWCNVTI